MEDTEDFIEDIEEVNKDEVGKGIKKRFKGKLMVGFISVLITISLVLAVWLIPAGIDDTAIYNISSDQPINLTITKPLLHFDIDTTNESVSFSDELRFLSKTDGDAEIRFSILKEDNNPLDNCDDFLDDCHVYLYDTIGYGIQSPLDSGDIISLSNGINNIFIQGGCKRFSCDQNISLQVSINLVVEEEEQPLP